MAKPIYRMSSSGYCPKRLSAMQLGAIGAKSPPWLSTSASEGNWHEQRLKQELRDLGCVIDMEQEELVLDYSEFKLVGHIDGRIKLTGEALDSPLFKVSFIDIRRDEIDFAQHFLLEVKSFSYMEWQRWILGLFDAFPWYAAQSACYEEAMKSEVMVYATKDRSNGTRRLYIVRGKRASVPEIFNKLCTVAQFTAQGQLAPAEFNLDSIECRRFCAFREALCSPPRAIIDSAEIEQAAHDYLQGRAQEHSGKAIADEAKAILVEVAKSKNLDCWQAGNYDIRYSSYTRESISIKGLSELLERSVFAAAIKPTSIERITVNDRDAASD